MTTISVLMPVYNAERYIAEAVESILGQSFADFEFLVVDDGSIDRSRAIVARYAARDVRIRLIGRPNTGIVGALNDGLAAARGEFVARMDADDVALPERFALQIDYLRRHPECLVVGCMGHSIDSDGASLGPWTLPLDHEAIDEGNLRGDQKIIHPALLAPRAALEAVGGYRPEAETSEDLDLFLRLAERGRLANVPDLLMKIRRHAASICHTRREHQDRVRESVLREAWRRRGLGPRPILVRPEGAPVPSVPGYHRSWAWTALKAGHVATARKHAWAAFRRSPLAVESWRVTYCALRGY